MDPAGRDVQNIFSSEPGIGNQNLLDSEMSGSNYKGQEGHRASQEPEDQGQGIRDQYLYLGTSFKVKRINKVKHGQVKCHS